MNPKPIKKPSEGAKSYVTITWVFFHTFPHSFGLHGDFKDRIVDELKIMGKPPFRFIRF